MSDFDALLAKYTEKGNPKVHGIIACCVDKNGNEIYKKVVGYDSLGEDAKPLKEDAYMKVLSATKLITSIAMLQCIEKGQIGLDEPVTTLLPELDGKDIVSGVDPEGKDFESTPAKNKITPRQLLTHTSGLAYENTFPALVYWRKRHGEPPTSRRTPIVSEIHGHPLIFEPGLGWAYGGGLDWAGYAVRCLNNNISLEEYFNRNIWSRVGRSTPFPTFNHSARSPEYAARMMQPVNQTEEGLKPTEWNWADNPNDEEGGAGLVATTGDFMAVLSDLVSDSPKLLKPETISMMFSSQIPDDSTAMLHLIASKEAWETLAGPVLDDGVNHGLGGLYVVNGAPEIRQPGKTLTWAGSSNVFWFANKEEGVAGWLATQSLPYGGPALEEVVNAWKKDFWTQFRKGLLAKV